VTRVPRNHENRVVASERTDHLVQLGTVDGERERLSHARTGADDDELLDAIDAAGVFRQGALQRDTRACRDGLRRTLELVRPIGGALHESQVPDVARKRGLGNGIPAGFQPGPQLLLALNLLVGDELDNCRLTSGFHNHTVFELSYTLSARLAVYLYFCMDTSSVTGRGATATEARPADAGRASAVRVGIAGASGFAGQELLRWLAGHPRVSITAAMSSSPEGPVRSLTALAKIWDGVIEPFSAARLSEETDVVFLALPEEAAATIAPLLVDRGVRVIDLSGAFRLRDPAAREKWYPATRLGSLQPVYGLTERNYGALRGAQLVTNPGCYPTAALLALQPLAEAGLLAGEVVIDAKSGISGAGKKPTDRTHFSENHGSVSAYGVFGHRHQPEIEQELGAPVTFVPHLVPLDRGILETIYTHVRPGTTLRDVSDVMSAAYQKAPFVRLTGEVLPEIKHAAYTNFCDIGWRVDPAGGRILMVAVLDNLVKGAAGQAIQNFNVAAGFDERMGLLPLT
jgi:N-acetyl-gamma-glutamyl-phosphate reductase